jgi:PPP family 3-phenylpropionic acid transporter
MKISEANRLRILYFLVFCCTASCLPIFADYLKAHGLSGIKIGIMLSITPLMMFLVQPFYGMLADRLGCKKCLLLSSALTSVSYTFYLFNGGFVYLFIITIFMALFYNSIQPLLDSLSLTLVQKNPSFSYGTLRIAGAAGWAFTGIIAGHFIDTVSTTVIFVISAISMLLTFVFGFALKPDLEKRGTTGTQSFVNIKAVFENKILFFLLICVFLISAGATTIWNFYSLYMKENGDRPPVDTAFLSRAYVNCHYFIFLQELSEVWNQTTLLITVFATSLRLFLYSVVKNPTVAISIELLHGLSWSLFWVVCVEYVNMLVPEVWRATGQSLLYAAYYGAGAIAGNLWTGFLYDTKMKISEIFLLNAGIVFTVGLCMAAFIKNKKWNMREFRTDFFTDSFTHSFDIPVDKPGNIQFYRCVRTGLVKTGFHTTEIILT